MFSSVIATKDRSERSTDYTVFMEWHDNGSGSQFVLLCLLTGFIFPSITHTDITLSAQIRDNQEGVMLPVPPVRQGWNTTFSWLVLPVTLFGICDMSADLLKDTMYKTLALRVHEVIKVRVAVKAKARAEAEVIAAEQRRVAEAEAKARAEARAKAEAEAKIAEQKRAAEMKAKAEAEAKIRAEAAEKARAEAEVKVAEQKRAEEEAMRIREQEKRVREQIANEAQTRKQYAYWTPENIAKDPENYLVFCERESQNALDRLEVNEREIIRRQAEIKKIGADATVEADASEKLLADLKSAYTKAETGGGFPFTHTAFPRESLTQDVAKRKIVNAYKQVEGERKIIAQTESALRQLEANIITIHETRDELHQQLRSIKVSRTMLSVGKITDETTQRLAAIGAIVQSTFDVTTDVSAPINLDSFSTRQSGEIDDADFSKIMGM